MKSWSLKQKLITAMLFASIVPIVAVSLYTNYQSSQIFKQEAFDRLDAIKNVKAQSLKRYFSDIENQIQTFAGYEMVQDAMIHFSKAFKSYEAPEDASQYKTKLENYYKNEFEKKYSELTNKKIESESFLSQLSKRQLALQYHYIANNSYPLGSKDSLSFAPDESEYSEVHKKYHHNFKGLLKNSDFHDVFLVDIQSGEIVYSVYKEIDFATSLLDGPLSDSHLAKAFNEAKKLSKENSSVFIDFEQYLPSFGAPSSFIASPIWSEGKKVGVVIYQLPIDGINTIMSDRSGLGDTGETYLVGSDGLMRSDSYHDKDSFSVVSSFQKPEKGRVSSSILNKVKDSQSGQEVTTNYLGQEVLSVYEPLNILGLNWGVFSEKSKDEAFAPISNLRNILYIILAISCGFVLFLAFYLSSSISSALSKIIDRLKGEAQNLSGISDEVNRSSHELSRISVDQASGLQETVSSIDEISSMVQKNAESAKFSTEASTKSSQAVATGKKTVEEMISSISDISKSNDEMIEAFQKNNEDIGQIVDLISEIGEKTKVINDIVFQTKLLSFNASVEAARAGEHGKGFAVVAEEVGNLASMSGKAALEISEMLDSSMKQVKTIVDETKSKVDNLTRVGKEKVDKGTSTAKDCGEAFDLILENVSSVNEMVREIATASQEQAIGVQEVTKAMQLLDQSTSHSTVLSKKSSDMSETLKDQSQSISGVVEDLLHVVAGSKGKYISHHHDGGPYDKQEKPRSDESKEENILSFKTKDKEPASVKMQVQKKAVNSSSEVPSHDDPRFEEV